MGLLTFTGVCF
ncbi:hypothetical protein E2320_009508, partial [Naja naja]